MQQYKQMVDKHASLILSAFDYIWKNPETGYREWKTHRYLKDAFTALGYQVTEAGNIPGFIAEADTGRPGPTVLVFGEMDALLVPGHPECDPETGAVHACGHATQTAALLGLAAALKEPGALEGLSGKVRLCAVPAEESIEIEFRRQLMAQGIIRHVSGKVEFLRRGLLDGVDMAFMIHADIDPPHGGSMNGGSNGLIAKTVAFEGVSAHAGGLPHRGINALYAANLSLNAINALRETFQDDAHIRVHPIITAGGSSVNAIPDCVTMESYVRGATMDGIVEVNDKVNRAIAASAAAMGAKVEIEDVSAVWPRWNDRGIMEVFRTAMNEVLTHVDIGPERWGTGCSDMGDICSLMPMVQGYVGGAEGTEHGISYRISHPETACVDSAKVQMLAVRLLLENDAARARKIAADYKPAFACKEDYFAYVAKLCRRYDAVRYAENGDVVLQVGK